MLRLKLTDIALATKADALFMAGLDPGPDPAVANPHQFANDAIPVSDNPMEIARS
jgi:hypothetical protein